jgi:mRNA-degrading endonuclease RelE of RelBE toxin-antitoxin system
MKKYCKNSMNSPNSRTGRNTGLIYVQLSYYKLQAGDYRANIIWDWDNDILIIEAVNHRHNVCNRYLPP